MEKVKRAVAPYAGSGRCASTRESESRPPVKRFNSNRPTASFDCPLAALAACPGCDQVKLQNYANMMHSKSEREKRHEQS